MISFTPEVCSTLKLCVFGLESLLLRLAGEDSCMRVGVEFSLVIFYIAVQC